VRRQYQDGQCCRLSTLIFPFPLSLSPILQREDGLICILGADSQLLGPDEVEAGEEVADGAFRGGGAFGSEGEDFLEKRVIEFEGNFGEGSLGSLLIGRGDLQGELCLRLLCELIRHQIRHEVKILYQVFIIRTEHESTQREVGGYPFEGTIISNEMDFPFDGGGELSELLAGHPKLLGKANTQLL
jgi:hypothetical protein